MILHGGCLCGAVRYSIGTTPTDIGWCHCRMCQLNSGSPAMPFANLPDADFAIEAGTESLVGYASSEQAERRFCGTCGTPLCVVDTREPGMMAINVATLDEPDAITPGYHIYYAGRISWAPACDDLPQHSRGRGE